MGSFIKSVRVTIVEQATLERASVLLGLSVSALVQQAVTDAAHRLGIFAGEPDPAHPAKWDDAPDRSTLSATERLSVSFNPITYEVLRRVAERTGAGETRFIVGATLRYIARLKAGSTDAQLRTLKLPAPFDSPHEAGQSSPSREAQHAATKPHQRTTNPRGSQ